MQNIAKKLTEIREKSAEAAQRSGRRPEEVSLVAVSKTHTADKIREAVEAGQRVFGENRVQEALSKAPMLPSHLSWHLVGHLQANKVRKALVLFDLLHGVDSVDLARNIDRIANEMGVFPRILLEVNISGEASKFGFVPKVLEACIEELLALPRVQIDGLMTIAPFSPDPENARPFFARLREFRDRLTQRTSAPLSTLSMGMSGDYPVAVEEGATLIRVGSFLFGERQSV